MLPFPYDTFWYTKSKSISADPTLISILNDARATDAGSWTVDPTGKVVLFFVRNAEAGMFVKSHVASKSVSTTSPPLDRKTDYNKKRTGILTPVLGVIGRFIEFTAHQSVGDYFIAGAKKRRISRNGNDFFDAGVVTLFGVFR